MVYTSGERTKGLSVSEREALIKHMDANSSIPVKVDLFKQAQEYYYLGLYEAAYRKAMDCDSTNPAVMQVLLESLFRAKKKELKVFQSLIGSARNSKSFMLVKTANKLVGLSMISGINGFIKNEVRALHYLQNADGNNKEVLRALNVIIRKMQLKQQKEEEEKIQQEMEEALERAFEMERDRERAFNSKTKEVLDTAGRDCLENSRIAVTSLIIIAVCFIIAVLMPHNSTNWYVVASICSGFSILGMMWWADEKGSDNLWLVRKTPLKHTEEIPFRAISVKSKSFLKGDRLYKTILCVGALLLYFGLPLYVFYRIVKVGIGYLMTNDSVRHVVNVIVAKSSIDPTVFLPGFLLVFCIINFLAIANPIVSQLSDGFGTFSRVNDGKNDCCRIAIYDLKKDISYGFRSTVMVMAKEGLAFSVILTTVLCVLGWARPMLYRIFSILF